MTMGSCGGRQQSDGKLRTVHGGVGSKFEGYRRLTIFAEWRANFFYT
jgi:hypothetical protein